MKHLIAAAVIAATAISATPSYAGANNFLIRGLGLSTCKNILHNLKEDTDDIIIQTYIGGYVTGLNEAAASGGILPESEDMANNEHVENLARMFKLTCGAHPNMTFMEAFDKIIVNIQKKSEL